MSAPPTAYSMMWQEVLVDGTGAGRQPPSRKRTSVSNASSRAVGQLLVGDPALGHGEQLRIGPQVVAEQRQVAGDVRERRQQRRDLGFFECGADLVVGRGDRLDCADERTGRQGRVDTRYASSWTRRTSVDRLWSKPRTRRASSGLRADLLRRLLLACSVVCEAVFGGVILQLACGVLDLRLQLFGRVLRIVEHRSRSLHSRATPHPPTKSLLRSSLGKQCRDDKSGPNAINPTARGLPSMVLFALWGTEPTACCVCHQPYPSPVPSPRLTLTTAAL